MFYMTRNPTDELYHHGIKGMKWGVRRYRNYDGSYTQAGLKRYDKAMETYEKRKTEYKVAKTSGLKGDALKLKRAKTKEAKREVSKHYDHLKYDKRADKGKILYSQGYRIRENAGTKLMKAGTTAATISGMAYANGLINKEQFGTVAAISSGSFAVGAGIKFVNQYRDRNLRAYYGHTSKY